MFVVRNLVVVAVKMMAWIWNGRHRMLIGNSKVVRVVVRVKLLFNMEMRSNDRGMAMNH